MPTGQTSEQTLPSEAYYVVMRMPGESERRVPAAPADGPDEPAEHDRLGRGAQWTPRTTGTTRVYRFPADTTIFGPAQIEARIDQDPIISQQVTLWNQSGSNVIRGNLIVVPLGDSLIYLQPVYLQSTGSAFPEFQRIVVASPREVVWARTLGEALAPAARGRGRRCPRPDADTDARRPARRPDRASPTPAPTPGATRGRPLPTDVPGLIDYANGHFELAQAALRTGDFARYGAEIALVEAAARATRPLAPGLGLAPGASASPAP